MNPVLTAKKLANKIAKEKNLKMKEALLLLAKENHFSDWKSYKNSIDTFWYSKKTPFLTSWFTIHADAKAYQVENGGFILTYKGQYFVVAHEYIDFLGLDSQDSVWKIIDFDVSTANALEKIHQCFPKI